MKMVAISAISAWLVQMFDVAFSRRMCCSRVESVSTNPRWPLLVDGLADEASGHLANELLLRRDHAGSTVRQIRAARRTTALPW